MEGGDPRVDAAHRTDGSRGFDELRRGPEGSRGRCAVGHHGHRRPATVADALAADRAVVPPPSDAGARARAAAASTA